MGRRAALVAAVAALGLLAGCANPPGGGTPVGQPTAPAPAPDRCPPAGTLDQILRGGSVTTDSPTGTDAGSAAPGDPGTDAAPGSAGPGAAGAGTGNTASSGSAGGQGPGGSAATASPWPAQPGTLPAGFTAAWALRCQQTDVEYPGEGRWSVLVEQRTEGSDLDALVAALRRPWSAPAAGPCPAMAFLPPYLVLVDARGRGYWPALPGTGAACRRPP